MTNLSALLIHLLGGYTADEWSAERTENDERIADLLTAQREHLQKVMNATTATPEGCKRGAWCAACAFGKRYTARVGNPIMGGSTHTTYVCLKGCCDQFIAREEDPA